ncbi:MAG: type II toxin-antitoxin system prevent-host-death family antitoxin [Patescibacteria group bacterium]
MSLTVSLDQIIPFSQARANLADLLDKVKGKYFLVVTKRQQPKVALVDTDYLATLITKKESEEMRFLAENLQTDFKTYLNKKGLKANRLTDAQAEKILQAM